MTGSLVGRSESDQRLWPYACFRYLDQFVCREEHLYAVDAHVYKVVLFP